ncbi:hypothetical protein LJ656_02320 [Paraburkholderia sp. MMS20-SJTR3]|uniref:Uncharacterized protein n=1 Tax=Paraburkholderia sejongensis TaxID=2886946 RepID=A0ABS8JNW5_9BURK|nr:hypothetical protein [Paraburkholderia sp. MMS20-SJTR3]MCC8391408.1 hypothetical protein [Paraburkholderia sp. MMS20-SJTR3]
MKETIVTRLHCAVCPSDPRALRVARGQSTLVDLRAGTAIVAVEGELELCFRDHSLAWLGSAAPVTSFSVREGEQFVIGQHGVVAIRAPHASAALRIAPASSGTSAVRALLRGALPGLASFVARQLRRLA